jgi:hypothetical protein
MNEITVAGIRAKPIDTTNEVKIPPAEAVLYLSFSVIGYGVVVVLSLKFGLPRALFKIAS